MPQDIMPVTAVAKWFNTEPPFPWKAFDAVLIKAFETALRLRFPLEKSFAEALAFLMGHAAAHRPYAVLEVLDLQTLWASLRDEPLVLDSLLETQAVVFSHTWTTSHAMDRPAVAFLLSEGSSNATGSSYGERGVDTLSPWTIEDEAFASSVGTADTLFNLTMANPWYMVFLLLVRSGRLNAVRPIEVPPPEGPKHEG